MAKKSKVERTLRAGPMDPKLEVKVQRQWRSSGKMGGIARVGFSWICQGHLSMDDTWKESRAANVKTNSLCRILTPDI